MSDKKSGLLSTFNKVSSRQGNQKQLVQKIHDEDVIFAIGPAGTGKTLVSVSTAVDLLKHQKIKQIILTRPLVTVGNPIGFLPGNTQEKTAPFMGPFLKSLEFVLSKDDIDQCVVQEKIIYKSLSFMRGETLSNAFVLADEMQNSTSVEMEMLMTRFGEGAKFVIAGDPKQSDLPAHQKTGLEHVFQALQKMEEQNALQGVGVVQFNENDIARHSIVRQFVTGFNAIQDNNRRQNLVIPKTLLP